MITFLVVDWMVVEYDLTIENKYIHNKYKKQINKKKTINFFLMTLKNGIFQTQPANDRKILK